METFPWSFQGLLKNLSSANLKFWLKISTSYREIVFCPVGHFWATGVYNIALQLHFTTHTTAIYGSIFSFCSVNTAKWKYRPVYGVRSSSIINKWNTAVWNDCRSTYIAEFVQITEQILRLRKHQEPFYLNFLQRFHETLKHNYTPWWVKKYTKSTCKSYV